MFRGGCVMGFLKDLMKGFTMTTDELISETDKVIAESEKKRAMYYKEKEGLDYIRNIYSNNVWGIEEEYGKISHVLLFEDRLRFDTEIKGRYRDLLLKDILNIEVLNDIQIEEKSKVGQMMVIGIFALATKSKKEEVLKRRLVINTSESDIKFSIIIDTVKDSLTEAKKLNDFIKEYKDKIN